MQRVPFRIGALVACLVGAAIPTTVGAISISFDTVAISGGMAAGADPGISFTSFALPLLGNSGAVMFRAGLAGATVSVANETGYWTGDPSTLELFARRGMTAPGTTSGFDIKDSNSLGVAASESLAASIALNNAFINNAGDALLSSQLVGQGPNTSVGLWTNAGGSLSLVARAGDSAPGPVTGATFASMSSTPHMNAAGEIVFSAIAQGSGFSKQSEWTGMTGSIGLLHFGGDQAPDTLAGTTFNFMNGPMISENGITNFHASLVGSTVTSANDQAIWTTAGGALGLVAREGDAAPAGAGVIFAQLISSPVSNDVGEVGFSGTLAGAGVISANNEALFTNAGGALSIIARTGDGAPGTASVFADLGFTRGLDLNSAGDAAFIGRLTGGGASSGSDLGIWFSSVGTNALVARTGSAAPGTAPGVDFATFGGPVLNNSGDLAFLGILTGTGVNATNNRGFWLRESSGLISLMLREGDTLDVAPGDTRTISALSFADRQGFGRVGFNDQSQLAFLAEFTDGSSGIFLASLAAPEPPTALLIAVGILGLGWARRSAPDSGSRG